MESSPFDVKFLTRDTRDKEEVQTSVSISSESKPTVAYDYQLACDKLKREII